MVAITYNQFQEVNCGEESSNYGTDFIPKSTCVWLHLITHTAFSYTPSTFVGATFSCSGGLATATYYANKDDCESDTAGSDPETYPRYEPASSTVDLGYCVTHIEGVRLAEKWESDALRTTLVVMLEEVLVLLLSQPSRVALPPAGLCYSS